MKFITSPEPHGEFYAAVFLAGSIEQGKAKPWHQEVANQLAEFSDGLVVLNPRREQWDASLKQDISNPVFKEQVNWEIDGIDKSSVIFFYFQGDTLSPITLLELGYVLGDQGYSNTRVVMVCEPEFWRRGNVQIMVDRANGKHVKLYDDLESGILEMKRILHGIMRYEHF